MSAPPGAVIKDGHSMAKRRWAFARERLIVDKKGCSKLLELTLTKNQHTDRYGLTARLRPQANGHPGLVLWEECNAGLMGDYNKSAKKHEQVKKFSVILEVNGKVFNADMLAEMHAMNAINLKIRVPCGHAFSGSTRHFDDVMNIALPLHRVKKKLEADSGKGAAAGGAAAAASSDAAAPGVADSSGAPGEGGLGDIAQEDPETMSKKATAEGAEMGEIVKETLEAEIAAEHREAASTTIDEEMGASIETFLADPQAFRIMTQMLSEEGANSSATMHAFMDDVKTHHVEAMKNKAKGFWSSLTSCASCASSKKPEG